MPRRARTITLGSPDRMRSSAEPMVGVPDRSISRRTGCSSPPGSRSVRIAKYATAAITQRSASVIVAPSSSR
jgi:hypothetical protein